MTQKRTPKTKAAPAGPEVFVSADEKAIIDRTVSKAQAIGSAFEAAKSELQTALTLVGSRYGVDLTSGRYNIEPSGRLVEIQPQGVPAGQQFLTE